MLDRAGPGVAAGVEASTHYKGTQQNQSRVTAMEGSVMKMLPERGRRWVVGPGLQARGSGLGLGVSGAPGADVQAE